MSGHARRIPEASVHPAVWRSPGSLVVWGLSRDRQTRTIVQEVAVHSANAFNLSRLRSRSLSRRPSSLAVALHARSYGLAEVHVGLDIPSLWNIWMCSFKLYGKWSVQTSIHTRVRNAVTLVWDSLRLAPNIYMCSLKIYHKQASIHRRAQRSLASLGLAQAHPIKRERRNT